MAYTDKVAEITFKDVHFDTSWHIAIYDRETFAGTVTDLRLTGTPALLRYGGKGDIFDVVHGSELTINILAGPADDYDWIKTSDETRYLVELKKDTVLYWTGFVMPGQSVEDYLPYRVLSVVCSDRLGMLANDPYLNDFGNPYEGWAASLAIIQTALAKTGLSLPVRVIDSLYESSMDKTAVDDPYNQLLINQVKFNDNLMNAVGSGEVIQTVLAFKLARIFQADGIWYIVRVPQLDAESVAYRDFLATEEYSTNGTLAVSKEINTTNFRFLRGTQTENTQIYKQITISEDFGQRKSLLDGYDFQENEFVTTTTWHHWTRTATSTWVKKSGPTKPVIYCPTSSNTQYIISDGISVTSAGAPHMELTIKGGLWVNQITGGASLEKWKMYFKVAGVDGHNYFFNGTAWITDTVTVWEPETIKESTLNEPTANRFLIEPWPVDGTFTIAFWDRQGVLISSVELVQAAPLGATYYSFPESADHPVIVNADNREIPDAPVILLTDTNTDVTGSETFYNGFMKVGTDYSTAWTLGSGYYKLWEWMAQGYKDQFATPSLKLRANILGQMSYFQTIKAMGKLFVSDDIEIDLRRSQINGTFIEIKTGSTAVSLTATTEAIGVPAMIGVKSKSQTIIKLTGSGQLMTERGDTTALKVASAAGGGGGGTTAPYDGIRAARDVDIASGANAITFSHAFADGLTYSLRCRVVSDSGDIIGFTVTLETIDGFTITVDEAGMLDYEAIQVQ